MPSIDMTSPSEYQKMLAGELYLASDPGLVRLRRNARMLTRLFNSTTEEQVEIRAGILRDLFGTIGSGGGPRKCAEIEPPFHCDYGSNIHVGDGLYMNFGCVVLDCARVTIGDNVLIGPGVHIYAATHPVDPEIRRSGREYGQPVTIGNNVWIGGGTIICPGVSIGDNCVIGAGSVVTREVSANSVAVGNPCRVIRRIEAQKDEGTQSADMNGCASSRQFVCRDACT